MGGIACSGRWSCILEPSGCRREVRRMEGGSEASLIIPIGPGCRSESDGSFHSIGIRPVQASITDNLEPPAELTVLIPSGVSAVKRHQISGTLKPPPESTLKLLAAPQRAHADDAGSLRRANFLFKNTFLPFPSLLLHLSTPLNQDQYGYRRAE